MELIPAGLFVILSIVSPALVQFIVNRSWSKNTKTLIAVGISVLIAVVYGIISGDISLAFTSVEAFLATAGPAVTIAYGIQQVIFNTLFKDSELAHKLEGTGTVGEDPELEGNGYGEELDEFIPEDDVIVLEQD